MPIHYCFLRKIFSAIVVATLLCLGRSPAAADANATIVWPDIRQFGVEGCGWTNTQSFYDRLPAKAEGVVRPPVWDLSHDSAGMCVRFVTDATTIRACWALINSWLYLPNETAIVFYGTSILQGLAASRPGMVHSAILQRKFNWSVINLGFSGNGEMDPAMAGLLAELDPSVYVIDCLPNMVADQIKARTEPLVRKLRAAHPDRPIVLVEDRTMQDSFLIAGRMKYYHLKDRAALKSAYERLQQAGVKNRYYTPGANMLGDDGEATVDRSHPADLGFARPAKIFAKPLVHC